MLVGLNERIASDTSRKDVPQSKDSVSSSDQCRNGVEVMIPYTIWLGWTEMPEPAKGRHFNLFHKQLASQIQ